MKTTPVKVSTPILPTLPAIREDSKEELSEELSVDERSINSNSSNSNNNAYNSLSLYSNAMYMEEIDDDYGNVSADDSYPSSHATVGTTTTAFPSVSETTLRRQDYQTARLKRRAFYQLDYSGAATSSYATVHQHGGAIGLFQYVSGVRKDLAWVAQKSYYRQHKISFMSWHDYDKRQRQKSSRPLVSYGLVLLCTILLVASLAVGDWHFAKLSHNPSLGPSVDVLVQMGALSARRIIEDDEWHRIFTATILHGGLFHWLCNVMAIMYLGPELERSYGSFTVGLVFVVAASAANLVSAVLAPLSISVGASGGICAWYGLCLVDGVAHWPLLRAIHAPEHKLEVASFAVGTTLCWMALEVVVLLVFGLLPWVDNFGHLGGLFFGICLGIVLHEPVEGMHLLGLDEATTNSVTLPLHQRRRQQVQWLCNLKAIILCLTIAFCATNILWLHQSYDVGDLPCRQCRYLDCPPLGVFTKFCDPCRYITEAYYQLSSGEVDIEMHCPYGDVVYFVLPTLPTDRDAWISACHARCDI